MELLYLLLAATHRLRPRSEPGLLCRSIWVAGASRLGRFLGGLRSGFWKSQLEVSENWGTPKWMVDMENPIGMDDLGLPPF